MAADELWFDYVLKQVRANDAERPVLHLSGAELTKQDIENLASALSNNKIVWCLDLSNNSIDDDVAKSVSEILRKNHVISVLLLQNNKIGDEGAHAIAAGLQGREQELQINLSKNSFSSQEVPGIISILQNPSIEHLGLSDNRLNDTAAATIQAHLLQMPTRELYLEVNLFGNDISIKDGMGMPYSWCMAQM